MPDYYASRILYWFDKHTFYPLRTETYGQDDTPIQVQVRLTKLANPDLGDHGYGPFIHVYWDVEADLLTYNIRDGIRPMRWSKSDELTFFHPDFMRRQWFLAPVRSYLGVDRPEEFFLRPQLEPGKFPRQRSIQLSSELRERLQAQDAAGRLVFAAPTAATPPVQQITQKR